MIRTAIEVLLRDTRYEIAGTAAHRRRSAERDRGAQARHPAARPADARRPTGMDVLRALRGARQGAADRPADGGDRGQLADGSAGAARSTAWCSRIPTRPICSSASMRVRAGRSWIDPELARAQRRLDRAFAGAARPALAPRERELISFVRQGLRNREIAKRARRHRGHGEGLSPRACSRSSGSSSGPSLRSAPTNSSPKAIRED